MQPHHLGGDALNSPLGIIHKMDIFDKHRELLIVQSVGNLLLHPNAPPEVIAAYTTYTDDKSTSEAERAAAFRALNKQGKVLPDVAFAELGEREMQPVIPTLYQLSNEMAGIVAAFMAVGS
jgi:hypothetical protein